MWVTKRRQVVAGMVFCLLITALSRLAGTPPPGPAGPRRSYPRSHAPRARPFDAALREAVEWQQRAVDQAAHNQEALKAWDPKADSDGDPDQWRDWQRQIARDPSGDLHRARAEAQRAAALARNPHERCRAGALLAALDCSLGHHDRELQEARRLVELEPRSQLSLSCLRHAARCNGLKRLEQQIDVALRAPQTGRAKPVLQSPRHTVR